ncbi:MAG: formylglycine-generating enzyme family protein [Deltaproteobacteria bacterium]|nr:formylglycine-generating enzyme family protein [Deltaproteobacteria bacterium]
MKHKDIQEPSPSGTNILIDPCQMILIPEGEFNMGNSSPEETEFPGNEYPLHKVFVSSFKISRYLVTNELWKEVLDWAKANGYEFEDVDREKNYGHPVTLVNWYDAVKWCNALSEMEGKMSAYYTDGDQTNIYRKERSNLRSDKVKWNSGYRLLTEAEWEKAARGGLDGHYFPWLSTGGTYVNHIDCGKANYLDCNKGGTTPVGSYPPNGYNLYDMAGNVAEWVFDFFHSGWYQDEEASRPNTCGPQRKKPPWTRVIRGGSFNTGPRDLRCSYRGMKIVDSGVNEIGFRVALGGLQE